MKNVIRTSLLSLCLLLVASCANVPASEQEDSGSFSASKSEARATFLHAALNTEYVLASERARQTYAVAGKSFHVFLKDGNYQSFDAALLRPYDHVQFLQNFITYGSLQGSDKENLVGAIRVGSGEASELEIVALVMSGSTAVHRVSYPLGRSALQSLTIKKGRIHAVIQHRIPSDPSLRTTEYILEPL